jgi:hypothetical protein
MGASPRYGSVPVTSLLSQGVRLSLGDVLRGKGSEGTVAIFGPGGDLEPSVPAVEGNDDRVLAQSANVLLGRVGAYPIDGREPRHEQGRRCPHQHVMDPPAVAPSGTGAHAARIARDGMAHACEGTALAPNPPPPAQDREHDAREERQIDAKKCKQCNQHRDQLRSMCVRDNSVSSVVRRRITPQG